MLVYMGMDGDAADERGAKLKALQEYFKEASPRAFNMLGASDLASSNKDRGASLVVNSHGNINTFADLDPDAFVSKLQEKGFQSGSFENLYLMACQVGKQDQNNSILNNFARDVKLLITQRNLNCKVYAPRGTLSYNVHTEVASGQTYYKVDEMFIRCPERNYPLSEGLLLVQ